MTQQGSDPRKGKLDQFAVKLSELMIRFRWPVVIGSLVIAASIGFGAKGLFFNTSYSAFFSEENPQLSAFEALQDIYTKNDNILFVVAPKDGEVFTNETLAAVDALTSESWQVPYAMRVDAITNFQHTFAEEDDLIVQDLVDGTTPQTPELLSAAQQVALAEPLLANRLIDADASVTGVNVTLQFPGERADETGESVLFA
ncbi:MAG: hypothetical protein HKN13_09515, partial [Rhodothermales bacterium]|nr:hypothetical protein [Rhodothermales bacterium]